MTETIKGVLDYLVGVQFHPAVTVVIFLMIAVGKQRWEEPYVAIAKQASIDAALATGEAAFALIQKKEDASTKAVKNANLVMLFAWFVSIFGEFAMYWPKSTQAQAICFFMAFAQIGAAWFAYYFIDHFGIADRIGLLVQKKIEKVG